MGPPRMTRYRCIKYPEHKCKIVADPGLCPGGRSRFNWIPFARDRRDMQQCVIEEITGKRAPARRSESCLCMHACLGGWSVLLICCSELAWTLQIVRVDQAPPPATTGRSCIYILRTPGGEFYVGESDKLSSAPPSSDMEDMPPNMFSNYFIFESFYWICLV